MILFCPQEQEDSYNFLLTVYEKVLEALKDGACLSSVYVAAMDHIEQNKPELLEHFTTTAGYVRHTTTCDLYLSK